MWIGQHAPRSAASADILALTELLENILEIRPLARSRTDDEDAHTAPREPSAKLTA
jgi:hypothetical protein